MVSATSVLFQADLANDGEPAHFRKYVPLKSGDDSVAVARYPCCRKLGKPFAGDHFEAVRVTFNPRGFGRLAVFAGVDAFCHQLAPGFPTRPRFVESDFRVNTH